MKTEPMIIVDASMTATEFLLREYLSIDQVKQMVDKYLTSLTFNGAM